MAARNSLVDRVKGALILLVVFGHLLEIFIWDSAVYRGVYAAIYVFHMPLFVGVAGYFARESLSRGDLQNLVTRVIVPLVVCQAAFVVPLAAAGKPTPAPLQPYWILWFLVSLLCWRLVLPLVVQIRGAIFLSVILAIAAGFSEDVGSTLSFARTIYFLPFFLAGHLYGERCIAFARANRGSLGVAFFLITAAVGWWSMHELDITVLYGSKSYMEVAVFSNSPAVGRLVVMVLSCTASLGFIALLPNTFGSLTYLGQRTMAVFLIHGFLILVARGAFKILGIQPSGALLLAFIPLTFAVAYAIAPLESVMKRCWAAIGRIVLMGQSYRVPVGSRHD